MHLYVDTDNWLVAYFTRDEPSAKIMKWPEEYDYSPLTKVNTTPHFVLEKAASTIHSRFSNNDVKYYNFKYPEANAMTLFVESRLGGGEVKFKIPVHYQLYEASYYIARPYRVSADLSLNGHKIASVREFEKSGWYENIKMGSLNEVTIHDSYQRAAFATLLIYKAK